MFKVYTENYKTMLRIIKDDINQKIYQDNGLGDSMLLKCQFSQNWPVNIMQSYLKSKKTCDYQAYSKMYMKMQRT